MRITRKILLLVLLSALFGCTLAKVDVEVVSERTALENQVLGAYNSLDRDMLMVASVRGVDSRGKMRPSQPQSREKQDAVAAMQLIAFHADDLDNFQKLGWAGENNQGLISSFEMKKNNIPSALQEFADNYPEKEFQSVIQQVNRARTTIMQRVIDMNENLKDEDMPKVRKVFAKLNREKARPGCWIQDSDGRWKVKP